ncbi:hypothetical protein DXG03_007671 [Asterophora parasitica]|uniref:Phytase-like domain-containing protein n=1 Tax=Asterophora parasitica TaxID=117018 RepID=A0A9P7G9R0_9AGAR|nr:hypothetical protein DXG03_007671 [Asterophora parasitica]
MLASIATPLCLLALLTPRVRSSQTLLHTARAATSPISVNLNGVTYVNKGLVGFGLIPSDFRESTGDTLGGIGSGIDLKVGTWKRTSADTYTGTFIVTPDRGYNVETTVDYQSRQHEIDFAFTPYYGSAKLSFSAAQKTLALTYKKTVLGFERNNTKTSGLDATGVRAAQNGFPQTVSADPQLPIASELYPHLSLDVEGIIANNDGSDEYGPYIYRFTSDGKLIQTIQPPNAFLPRDASGALYFTSETNPATGRAGNKGFEGLTLDRVNNVIYAILQTATIQDGGGDKTTARYTRLVAYDVSNPSVRPPLVGEWVVPLPLSSKGKAQSCSEIQFVSPGVFLALSRDGDGRGGDDNNTKYKQADLFSITGATDIHGTKYDDPANPVAPDGKLVSSITPATYVPFVDYVESTGLARFGLHNGKSFRSFRQALELIMWV